MNCLAKIVCLIIYITALFCEATAYAKKCGYCKENCTRSPRIIECSEFKGPGDYYCLGKFDRKIEGNISHLYEERSCVKTTDKRTIRDCRYLWTKGLGYMCFLCTKDLCNIETGGIQIEKPIFLLLLLGCVLAMFF